MRRMMSSVGLELQPNMDEGENEEDRLDPEDPEDDMMSEAAESEDLFTDDDEMSAAEDCSMA